MKKVILTKGLPGSGKSYWAKRTVQTNKGQYKRVNKDDLREMLDNSKWSRDNEKFILKIRDAIILEALEKGKNIIIDDTNFSPKHENHIRQLVRDKAEVEIKDFTDVKLELCIKRDLQREKSVGKDVILGMYNQYLKSKKEKVKWDSNLADNCIICDIDGTLALMHGRSPFDWDKVDIDQLNKPIARLIKKEFKQNTTIILVSGRDAKCRLKTEEWLKKHEILHHELYMRPEGNMEDDRVIKEKIYNEHIKNRYNVLFVLDDRPKMVRHWKDLGLFVLDCNQEDSRIDF